MNDNFDSSLAFIDNDDEYYDSIGEDRDGLGAARGFFVAFCGAVLLIIVVIEVVVVMMALFG